MGSNMRQTRGGIRLGETLGSPVAMWIENRDFANWRQVMDPLSVDPAKAELRRMREETFGEG